jgi:flagellar motor switch protein FliG
MRAGQKLPSNVDDLDGIAKAAILLLSLDHEAAGAVLKELPTEMVEEVTRQLASLGEVPRDLAEQVVEEFHSLRLASQYS